MAIMMYLDNGDVSDSYSYDDYMMIMLMMVMIMFVVCVG